MMKQIRQAYHFVIASRIRLFFFFWISVVLVYFPSFHAGYVAEFINYYQSFLKDTVIGFLNRDDAYVKSLYQVIQAMRFFFFSSFGFNPYFWFLFFTIFHSLNAVLVFTFFFKLFADFNIKKGETIAIAGTLIFLFSPNITEVTIWKACEHYLTGVMLQLLIANWVINYLRTFNRKYVWFCSCLFAVSIFTLEIFYATPFITLFLIIGYYLAGKIKAKELKKGFLWLYVPQLLLFLFHLILFKLIYGTWVAHYGTTNEFVWSFNDIISGYGKYFGYIIFNIGHLPLQYRNELYLQLNKPFLAGFFLCFILFVIIWGLIRFKKCSPTQQMITFLLGVLLCSLTLVVTTYYHELFSLYNSRRCYQTGIFMYMLIVLLMFSFNNKKVSLTLFSIYFLLNFILLEKMIFRWKTASNIQMCLINDFKWNRKNAVLLLNIPTYYNDVRILSANSENEFNTQSQIWTGDSVRGKLYEVSSFNAQTVWDGAHVTVVDSNQIKVTLNQWGSWWMYNYLGQTNYENELYRLEVIDIGHEYLLHLKQLPKETAILFYSHKKWNPVNLNQKGEQW